MLYYCARAMHLQQQQQHQPLNKTNRPGNSDPIEIQPCYFLSPHTQTTASAHVFCGYCCAGAREATIEKTREAAASIAAPLEINIYIQCVKIPIHLVQQCYECAIDGADFSLFILLQIDRFLYTTAVVNASVSDNVDLFLLYFYFFTKKKK